MQHVQVLSRPVEISLDEAGDSVWRLPPDIESEITTLATVCHVKHQQRTPLAAGREEDIREADSSDDEESEIGSNFATDVVGRLGTGTIKSIRMRFLDQLAELICRKKEADYVTCTSLMESEEEATIFAARNAPWVDADIELLEKVANMLEVVASRGLLSEDVLDLREEFSMYYSPRLKHHAKALLDLLGKGEKMKVFTTCLKAFLDGRIPPPAFVELVDDLGNSTDFYSQLKDNFLPSKVHRQGREMEYICRPRHSFATFHEAAREIAGLKRVKIVLLPGYESREVPPQLSLCLKLDSVEHPKSLEAKLRKPKWVHAEMRMILHLLSIDNVARMFPYLGISKKTCLLCGHVLSQLGIFQARNNHGKVYGQWTLPRAIAMPAASHGTLDTTIQKLRDVLHHECNSEDNKQLAPIKESTISTPVAERQDIWSPFNRSIPDPRLHSREIEWLSQGYIKRIAGGYEPCAKETRANSHARKNPTDHEGLEAPPSDVTDDEAHSDTRVFEPVPENNRPSCGKCGVLNDGLISCQKCNSVLYCDKACLEEDWIRHKFVCRLGRPLDEVDDFIRACREETIPTNDNVAKAFGFCFFTSGVDRQRLFRLYCDLINQWGMSEEELRQAWKSDKLKELIHLRGSQVPSARIRNEVRWLVQQNRFGSGVVTSWDTVFETQRHILDPLDRTVPWYTLKPREKLEAYVFWCQITNGIMPDVDEDNWIFLGFCTASNDSQTQRLAQLYGLLVGRANFEDFWQARVSSKMVELFQKHSLGDEIRTMRNFESLMSAIGTWYQSVWELKRFTRLSQPYPHRAVCVDYGFMNCQTPVERLSLRDAYTQFFKSGGDEMALHQACIENRLAGFLRSELGSLSFDATLLESPYPLDGCDHMGMIVETAILCPESAYEEVKKLQQAQRLEGVILTHPDKVDAAMSAALMNRAAFLRQGVRIRTTRIGGRTIQSMSGM
ncbi:uncharacterized protein Aud_003797 [Aspergillus udagawae]|uniref:MYND-type domain-containing protein n=1 Tax=Aspergillus udagawae TaxID=91492 RepID=A0A8E0QRD3_9EURO|nr:uncharacterized protein Aud_003797 [Aspergillus udagawae]GIC87413.1 hypothetical protein Aud_003797 [Aspergillus udagawae]